MRQPETAWAASAFSAVASAFVLPPIARAAALMPTAFIIVLLEIGSDIYVLSVVNL